MSRRLVTTTLPTEGGFPGGPPARLRGGGRDHGARGDSTPVKRDAATPDGD